MNSTLLLVFALAVPIGIVLGWSANFIQWYHRKRSLRWAWLLCKPMRLTSVEDAELTGFYKNESFRGFSVPNAPTTSTASSSLKEKE